MNVSIFKAYDIRGLYPQDLDAEAARAIGRAVARFLEGSPVVVGRDMRESGNPLREALIQGLRAEGADVLDIGRVATPMVYFGTSVREAVGGVMITASHNPGGYNGFKICGERATPIGSESGLVEIRGMAEPLLGEAAPAARGKVTETCVQEEYFSQLLEMFPERPRLRIVIDAGNGIAGEAAAGLLDALPVDLTRLYFEPDGSFPHHEADPLKRENLEDLIREVLARGADLGMAFDGDGDRAVFIDETGEPVPADLMTALLVRVSFGHGLLGARPGSPIVYDLRSSRVVPETIRECGGEPVRSRVGHAFMKSRMRESGGVFGGELSGHYYFRFPAGYVADDGAAAFLMVLQALSLTGESLSSLWRPFERYARSGEVNREVQHAPLVLERVREAFSDGKADDLDGLTVEYPDWWFNLRPSNTEPLLRLNVEAPDEEALREHSGRLLSLIDEADRRAAGGARRP
jgi:phosphomannomutase